MLSYPIKHLLKIISLYSLKHLVDLFNGGITTSSVREKLGKLCNDFRERFDAMTTPYFGMGGIGTGSPHCLCLVRYVGKQDTKKSIVRTRENRFLASIIFLLDNFFIPQVLV